MAQVKEVGDGAKEGHDDADIEVNADTGRAADEEEVEVERINEKGHEARDKEYAVPAEDSVASGVEDPAWPPRPVAEVVEDRGRARGDPRATTEGEKPGGARADGPHLPRRSSGLRAASA